MCGIAGVASTRSINDLEGKLLSMQRSLKHRGPDRDGIYMSADQKLGLVHTRLAIQDLSEKACQPMRTPDGRYVVVFNGEIYNFKILRKQLEIQGEEFISNSDTEVILKLYQQKKEKCLDDLEGMFAFVVWDDLKKEMFLARDPIGIKPLYFANENGYFMFSSEHKSIRKMLDQGACLDFCAIKSFLKKGSVSEPFSVDQRVRMLPAGHWAYWRDGTLRDQKEYAPLSISSAYVHRGLKEAAVMTRQSLLDSVEKHFVSDVDVGLFLSGGLDSTVLLALSRELGYSKISTYTIGFKNLSDETGLARKTAKYYETNHHEIIIDSDSADKMLDGYLEATDQPTIDGFNVYVVSQFAHDQGAKVVLSGLGGDELFGGYKTLRTVPQLFKYASHPAGKIALSLASIFMKKVQKRSKWKRLYETLQKKITIESIYAAYRGIFTEIESEEILKALEIRSGTRTRQADFRKKASASLELAEQVDWLEWTVYLRDQLLRDADVFSMHFGLELRVPFVDLKLFKNITTIEPSIRLNRKNLLKAAVPEMPEWILKQPKRGFLFPFSSWNILDRHFKSNEIKRLAQNYSDWYQKWALLQLDHLLSKY